MESAPARATRVMTAAVVSAVSIHPLDQLLGLATQRAAVGSQLARESALDLMTQVAEVVLARATITVAMAE